MPSVNALLEDIHTELLNKAYYTEATRFVDLTTQTGGALDTLAVVGLGVSGADPEGLVSAENGVITINKTGPYMIKQNFQITRNTNPSNSEVFFQAQVSTDGGTVWIPIGNAINRRMANVNTINIFFDIAPIFAVAGTKFRNMWAKSSAGGDPAAPTVGVDNGLLIYTSPSAALLALGVQEVPSAIAVVYKLQGYNYV